MHSQPEVVLKTLWKTEKLQDANYFDELVGTCFDIAGLLEGMPVPAFSTIIDIRDCVNGIGNRSREPYIRVRTPCYSLHLVVRRC